MGEWVTVSTTTLPDSDEEGEGDGDGDDGYGNRKRRFEEFERYTCYLLMQFVSVPYSSLSEQVDIKEEEDTDDEDMRLHPPG